MASTVTGLVLWLFACQADPEQDPRTDADGPSDAVLLATGETGESTSTSTGDTGTPPIDVWPLCDHIGRTESITLLGADPLDALGESVDAADLDGDGCAEVAVAAPWRGSNQPGEGAVYLIAANGLATGSIEDGAAVIWQQPDEANWVYHLALVPPQVTWTTAWLEGQNRAALFFGLPEEALVSPVDGTGRAGELFRTDTSYRISFFAADDCSALGSPTLCLGSDHWTNDWEYGGAIWLYDVPIEDIVSVEDFRTRLHGEPGELVYFAEADGDLDGDGLGDLLVSALEAAVTGRVGLVSAPAVGDFLLWDAAWATLEGVTGGAEAGTGLATGDLDGDGHVDAFVGAAVQDGGYAYVMTGPFADAHSLADATVTIQGEVDQQWVGYDGAIGDMDGDGSAELIIGAPHSLYFGTAPGQVAVFSGASGTYTLSEASRLLVSGSTEPDAFGLSIAHGDLDGDGLLDLAIGAPNDPRAARQAGSVTLVFGASL